MNFSGFLLHTSGKLLLSVFLFAALLTGFPAIGETTADTFAESVVRIDTVVMPQGKTVSRLGARRTGSGVVIDASGLLVTAGYLVLEAESIRITFNSGDTATADVIANDLDTGLALLRVELPAYVKAVRIGNSGEVLEGDNAVVLSHGGTSQATVATVASIRAFAGSWEYAIARAFYTRPAYRSFSGAALINRDAELIGIGSLLLSNIYSTSQSGGSANSSNGNLFIPAELLTSRLGAMLSGNLPVGDPRPWLGVYLQDSGNEVVVTSVQTSGPADNARVLAGDVVMAVNSIRVQSMAELYETLWSTASIGESVALTLVREGRLKKVSVIAADRWEWLAAGQ